MADMGAVEFARHVRTLQRTCDDGFVFNFLRDDAGVPIAVRGVRHRCGFVDTYTVSSADHATAARFRAGEYNTGNSEPVWQADGAVLDVLNGLLALPAREQGETSG